MIVPTVMIFALGSLGACVDEAAADDDVCDAYEATDYGDDCGYWADDGTGTGVWLWYVWVVPYEGGTPSAGQKPTPPAGAKTLPPPKNKPPLPPGVKKPAAPPPPKTPAKPPAGPAKPPPPVKGK